MEDIGGESIANVMKSTKLNITEKDRYQSASGIKKDLEYCYQSLKSGIEVSDFVPGKDDVMERFETSIST